MVQLTRSRNHLGGAGTPHGLEPREDTEFGLVSAKAIQLLNEANLPGECRINGHEPMEMRDTGLCNLTPECGDNGCDL